MQFSRKKYNQNRGLDQEIYFLVVKKFTKDCHGTDKQQEKIFQNLKISLYREFRVKFSNS